MAILLHEEGLYPRSRIYATDMTAQSLRQAGTGTVAAGMVREGAAKYVLAGGRGRLSDYYEDHGTHVAFDPALRRNVVFAEHNLVTDRSFNEFNVVICRNVLIYFNRSLQERVHALLYNSITRRGFLGLGDRETIRFTPFEDRYEVVDWDDRLYRKVA